MKRLIEKLKVLPCWWRGGHQFEVLEWHVVEDELVYVLRVHGQCRRCTRTYFVGSGLSAAAAIRPEHARIAFAKALLALAEQGGG